MKFLLIAAAALAVAVASPAQRLVQPGAAGPAPIIDIESVMVPEPAIVDGTETIDVGPAIVDEFESINVGPAFADESVVPEPANYGLSSSPLVQIIVNVQSGSYIGGSPVVVEEQPAIIPDPVIVVDMPEIETDPVNVVPMPEIETDPVNVVPMPEIETDPVNVVPMPESPAIVPGPAIVLPEILN